MKTYIIILRSNNNNNSNCVRVQIREFSDEDERDRYCTGLLDVYPGTIKAFDCYEIVKEGKRFVQDDKGKQGSGHIVAQVK